MEEIWKPVVWYEGLYEVSNHGRVASLFFKNNKVHKKAFRIRRVSIWTNWYYSVYIQWNIYYIHRLVWFAFIPNLENKPFINHKNSIRCDNRVENLESCTCGENNLHSHRMNPNRKHSQFYKWKFWKEHIASKPILQFSREWIFIKTWEAMMDVERWLWISYAGISMCCSWRRKTAWWFIWRYK